NETATTQGNINLTSSGGVLTINQLVKSIGTMTVTLTADEINLSGTNKIDGGGTLVIQPYSTDRDITLGGTENVSGALTITAADRAAIHNSFSQIVFGRADGTGAITTAGNLAFVSDVVLNTPGVGSDGITISNQLNVGTNDLTLNSGSSITTTG